MRITADHVNSFIKPFINIMEEVVPKSGPISIGDLYITNGKKSEYEICVFTLVNGDLSGKIVLNINSQTAIELAEEMAGMPIDSFDDVAQDTISEFLNMVIGNAITELQTLDINISLTPPSIVYEKGYKIAIPECPEPLTIQLNTRIGTIELDMVINGMD